MKGTVDENVREAKFATVFNVKRKSHRSPIKTFTIKCSGDKEEKGKKRRKPIPWL